MHRIALMTASLALVAGSALAGQAPAVDSLEARVWLDRGDEPVVQRGDDVRVYYRTSADAYVAIFRIDTDGMVSLLFPQDPTMDAAVRGGRDYRLLFPNSARWRVDEDPGVGYFFMVASPEPLDLSLLDFHPTTGWDLSGVGATVYEDPYVAIDDYVATIVPSWDVVPYALDFLTYNVGQVHEYPRFLCYDCHSERSYTRWNPYRYTCPDYSVVIYDDPYFYPRYRYVGTRVVFARPLFPRPRYEVIVRPAGAGWAPIVRSRVAPARRTVEYKESPRSVVPRRAVPSAALPNRAGPRGAAVAPRSSRGGGTATITPPRRTTAAPQPRANTRAPAAGSGRASGAPSAGRPTLQRRPPRPSGRLPERAAPARGSSATSGSAARRPGASVAPGATSRGTTSRGTTSRGTASRGGASGGATRSAPSRGTAGPAARPPSRPSTGGRASAAPSRPPSRAVRPPAGGSASGRAPARAAPRAAPSRGSAPSTSRPRPGGSSGAARSRPAPSRPPAAGSSGRGGGGSRGATGARRPGGRGGDLTFS